MSETPSQDALYEWLNDIELSKPKKNLARDFSDGVLMAELLKKYFPRHVELHNYQPANSFSNKLHNWRTLNDKVLQKVGIGQTFSTLKEVSSSNRAAVEKILLEVKNKLTEIEMAKKMGDNEIEHDDGTRIVDHLIKSTVPYEEYKHLEEKILKKEEEVYSLQSKVEHLEALLSLRDQRINDLIFQIKRCTCCQLN